MVTVLLMLLTTSAAKKRCSLKRNRQLDSNPSLLGSARESEIFELLNGQQLLSWSDELSNGLRLYLNEKSSGSSFENDNELTSLREIFDDLFFESYDSLDLELVTSTSPKVTDFDLTVLSLEETHDYGLACACAGVSTEGEPLTTCIVAAMKNPSPKPFSDIAVSPQKELQTKEVCEDLYNKPEMTSHQTKILSSIKSRSEEFTKGESLTYLSIKESRQGATTLSSFVDKRNLKEEGRSLTETGPCDYSPMDPDCYNWVDSNGDHLYNETVEDLCVAQQEYWNGTHCHSCGMMFPGCGSCNAEECANPVLRECSDSCLWDDQTLPASVDTDLLSYVDGEDTTTCWCYPGEAWVQVTPTHGYCMDCDSFFIKPEICTLNNNCVHANHHNPSICYECQPGYGLNMCSLTCYNCDEQVGTTGCLSCEVGEDNGEVAAVCNQCIGEMVLTDDGKCEYPQCEDYDVYTADHLRTSAICNECSDFYGLNIQTCVACKNSMDDFDDAGAWTACIDCTFDNVLVGAADAATPVSALSACIECQEGWELQMGALDVPPYNICVPDIDNCVMPSLT